MRTIRDWFNRGKRRQPISLTAEVANDVRQIMEHMQPGEELTIMRGEDDGHIWQIVGGIGMFNG